MMETHQTKRDYLKEGEASYQAWQDQFWAEPENRRLYEEEAKKKELWLQLVEARKASGLTQKEIAERMGVSQVQVSRIEKRGYDAYTLRTLRRYLDALGNGFSLEVAVKYPGIFSTNCDHHSV
jgi:DNA-directed RNA polymerase specialized sigma subunit